MPLQARLISIRISVACFFVIAVIGCVAGLGPLTCCKRAVIGAVAAYFAASVTVKLLNDILIGALIKSRMEQQQKELSERGN